jgi:hypothetical protein
MVLMIAFLAVARSFNSQFVLSKVPGPERGDMTLAKESLPAELEGWKQVAFAPAEAPEKLPDGQFWWVHSWEYSDGRHACTVSLDQADWTVWHDLTICYRAVGWTLNETHVLELPFPEGGTWHVAVAEFSELSGRKALLVFSLFGSDGTPLESPSKSVFTSPSEKSFMKNLAERLKQPDSKVQLAPRKVNHDRVLQSQVFMTYTGTLSEEVRESVIKLHLAARPHFLAAWNQHWKQWQAQSSQ